MKYFKQKEKDELIVAHVIHTLAHVIHCAAGVGFVYCSVSVAIVTSLDI